MVKRTAHNGNNIGSSPMKSIIIIFIYLAKFGRREKLKIFSSLKGVGSSPTINSIFICKIKQSGSLSGS